MGSSSLSRYQTQALHWEPGVCVTGPPGQPHSGLFKPVVMQKLCRHSENDPCLTAYRRTTPSGKMGLGSEYRKEDEKEEGAGGGGRRGGASRGRSKGRREVMLEKPIWKGYILYDFNYMTFSKRQNCGKNKKDQRLPGVRGTEEQRQSRDDF